MRPAVYCTLLFLVTHFAACTNAPTNNSPPDNKKKLIEGWLSAPANSEEVAPSEALLAHGFLQSLPLKPVKLANALYRPWASGRAIAFHNGQLLVVDTDNDSLQILNAADGKIAHSIKVGARPEQVVVDSQGNAYVTVRHGGEVVRVDADSRLLMRSGILGTEPFGLALSSDQQTLYVSLRGDGEVVVLNPNSLEELGRVDGLKRPTVIATSAQGRIAVAQRRTVANKHAIAIWNTDPQGLPIKITRQLRLLRNSLPYDALYHGQRGQHVTSNRVRGMVFSPADNTLLSAHMQAFTGTENDVLNGVFNAIMMETGDGGPAFPPNGSGDGSVSGYGGNGIPSKAPHLLRPMVSSVTRMSADSEMVTTSGGATVAAVKDAQSLEPLTHLISQASDINHHPYWSLALVTGMGSDNVLVLNTNEADPMRSPLGIIDVGQAPKGVTFSDDGQHAYVVNSQSFKLSRIDLSPFFSMPTSAGVAVGTGSQDKLVGEGAHIMPVSDAGMPATDEASNAVGTQLTDPIRLKHDTWAVYGNDPLDAQLRQGRRIYTYSRNQKISHGGKFACASCHVEGEEDGLVWFIPGGVRQTPALAGRLANTAPFNWGGTEVELTNNMSKTIERMGGEGFGQDELKALEAYLLFALVPPPNPNVTSGSLTPAQSRGQAIFNSSKAACSSCHAGPAYTDGKNYDVGTLNELEQQVADLAGEFKSSAELPEAAQGILDAVSGKFNTPTLIDLHATAPYLHDGSAATLMDVLDLTKTSMGHSDHLTNSEKEDLVAYMLTL